MTKPAFAPLDFAPPALDLRTRDDGSLVLRSPMALEPYGRCLGEWLEHWGRQAPDRTFLAERSAGGGWRRVSYAQALASVRAIGQALLERRLSMERPLAVLSDNGVDHALMALAAMHVGVPVAPVSAAYSLVSRDHARLRYILDLLRPGLIFVQDGSRYAAALGAVDGHGAEIVASANIPSGWAMTPIDALLRTVPGEAVDRAYHAVGPDTIAKILFTSGSTGQPKGVINTQRMLCSNQQAIAQLWRFLAAKPPVIVDWLPWSHTFGANHNFNMMLRHGGSLYIDEGKPVPGLVEKTLANLREVSPTIYFNVPRGYDMILPHLESDEALRANFFRDLDLIFYAAAALPQNLWERLEDVAVKARGKRVVMVSAWGSTETAPLATSVHFTIERAGVIGLPAPGTEIRMVPAAGKMELRVRGPNVTPGYFKREDLTRAAFDEEGYYRIGDAGRFADPNDPIRGLEFDGRIAEDFKLSSGTWVHAGAVRLRAITAGAPLVQDCVLTGHDREEIGLLVFPSLAGARGLCPEAPADAALPELIRRPEVKAHMRAALQKLAAEGGGSASCPRRAILLEEPPSLDANEITDKGYINQRAVLMRRAALVERLYAAVPDPGVIRPGDA
ncbi:MAG: feruloyl-CoA synthase [Rhodocyclaceae bacterium]